MIYSITNLFDGYCEIIAFKKENGKLKPINKYFVGECDKPFYNGNLKTLFNILTDFKYIKCEINKPYSILRKGAFMVSDIGVTMNEDVNIIKDIRNEIIKDY